MLGGSSATGRGRTRWGQGREGNQGKEGSTGESSWSKSHSKTPFAFIVLGRYCRVTLHSHAAHVAQDRDSRRLARVLGVDVLPTFLHDTEGEA